jgi:predicted TPR repeat methyltransferase
MPGSVRENDAFVRNFVITNQCGSVLDVGAGQGTYANILWGAVAQIDGIEVWEPYVSEFSLFAKYNKLTLGDAREVLASTPDNYYDLVIFGDILEHMTEAEALTCWQEAARIASWGLISVPIIHYPQGAEGGNPYEVHVQDHLTPEHVREVYGPFDHEAVYNITGTFIKRF